MTTAAVAWQVASAANIQALVDSRQMNGISVQSNIRYAKARPVDFGLAVARAGMQDFPDYPRRFWGVFGWSKFSGPWWLRIPYLLLILIVAGTEQLHVPLTAMERACAAVVFLCGFAFVHLVIFVTDAHWCEAGRAAQLCFDNSAGIQGRYFIPFSLFGLLSLKQRRLKIPQNLLILVVGICHFAGRGGSGVSGEAILLMKEGANLSALCVNVGRGQLSRGPRSLTMVATVLRDCRHFKISGIPLGGYAS